MNTPDIYRDFMELRRFRSAGRDYRIRLWQRASDMIVIAPHGGGIEPGTTEIAEALAGQELTFYSFEGLRVAGNSDLHITSTNFNEPTCVELIQRANTVTCVHGCEGQDRIVYVGGLDEVLKDLVISALCDAGFTSIRDSTEQHAGLTPGNLCNRGRRGKGLQLEISEGQRRELFLGLRRRQRQFTTTQFTAFVGAVRQVLLTYNPNS